MIKFKHQPIPNDREITTLAKGSGIAIFGKFSNRTLQFFTQMILARLLDPVGFGLYSIGVIVLQVGTQIGLMGLDNGVIHFSGNSRDEGNSELNQVLNHSIILSIVSGVIAAGAIVILAPFLAKNVFHQPDLINVFRGFAIATALYIWMRVATAATRISRRMQFSALAEDILPPTVTLCLIVIMSLAFKLSVFGSAIALATGYAAGRLLASVFLRRLYPSLKNLNHFSINLFKKLGGFSLSVSLSGTFQLLLQSTPALMIGYFFSPREVGLYQVTFTLSMLSVIILSSLNSILMPMIPRLFDAGQMANLNEIFVVNTKWGLYICIPILLVFLLLPEQVLGIVYGRNYIGGSVMLILLTLGQIVNASTGAVGLLLVMTHNEKWVLMLSVSVFLICTGLNWVLIPRFGLIGAAIASAVSVAILNLIALRQVYLKLGLWPYDRRYFKGVIASCAVVLAILLVNKIMPVKEPFQLFMVSFISVFIFWIVLLFIGMDAEEKLAIRELLAIYQKVFLGN